MIVRQKKTKAFSEKKNNDRKIRITQIFSCRDKKESELVLQDDFQCFPTYNITIEEINEEIQKKYKKYKIL